MQHLSLRSCLCSAFPVQSSLINCIVQHQAGKLGTSYLKQYPLCSCFTNIDGSLCRGCIKIFYPSVNFCNNTPRNIKVLLKCADIYNIMHIRVYKSRKSSNNWTYIKSITTISGGQQKRTFIMLFPSPFVIIILLPFILNRPFANFVPESEGTRSAP